MSSFVERPRFTCALGGAIATVSALPQTIHIVHAPPGCAGNLAWTQAGGCGLQVGGYCGGLSMPGTNVQEREVVFGGGERLAEQVENTLKVMDGKLYFVLTSCVTEMIGDDVGSVVNPLAEAGVPILYAETGGFRGNSYRGYELVLESLLQNYVPASPVKQRKKVNLWGIAPYFDVFWRGNLLELRALLTKLGLEVNAFFTVDDSLEGIRQAGSAELNIVVSDVLGWQAADLSKEIHDIPYLIAPLPIGPSAASEFLTNVATRLDLPLKETQALIRRENQRYYQLLDPLTDCFNDMDLQRYFAVVADSNYASSITRFLADDLGWLPEAVVVTDILDDAQQQRVAARGTGLQSGLSPKIFFDADTSTIRNKVYSHWRNRSGDGGKYSNPPAPAFVIGSSLERELAKDLSAAHLSVSFPVANRAVLNRGYTGFNGGLCLVEDLVSAIISAR
ncbi:MAG: nitrogenase component 1 [Negativicutes bacterium]|nr:nitrogenase component 1 [Negativicutes bacterium]